MADYTPSIEIGPVATFSTNTVFALPARQVRVMSTAVLQVSIDGSSYADVAATTTGVDVTAVFAKCTTGVASVVVRV